MKKINAIIITKDIDFINSINSVLNEFVDIAVCNILSTIEEVLYMEKEKDFDIAFWDADVEVLSLEEQFKLLNKEIRVIIMSSKTEDAIDAFNIGAVDFLLKSVSNERLVKSVKKAKYLIEVSGKIIDINSLNKKPLEIIAVSSLNDVSIIPVKSIIYLQSQGRYTVIYTEDGSSVVSSKNLGVYEELLARNNFFRIHHSYVVNVDNAIKIQKKDGVYLEILNKKYLPISKRRVEGFYRFLGITK